MEEVARGGTVDNNPVTVVELIDVKVFFLQVLCMKGNGQRPTAVVSIMPGTRGNTRQRGLRVSHRTLKDSLKTVRNRFHSFPESEPHLILGSS